MPRDVIMPALGMAQDKGLIVAWHKQLGEAVAEGDVLFEVETDKATMEVEAQGAGFLTHVTAGEGDEVPVGDVIARISDSAEDDAPAPQRKGDPVPADAEADTPGDLPEGHGVIMPTLGMAQDSGRLVGWLVEPGAQVGADDPLFEVETDKATMEVPAGKDGYLAAQLAYEGEDVPTGQIIAIISAAAPDTPVVRSAKEGAPKASKAEDTASDPAPQTAEKDPAPKAKSAPKPDPAPQPDPGGRILASPKARRLALEEGLDLARLVKAGVPQPYHVSDLQTLRDMPAEEALAPQTASAAGLHATAEIPTEGLTDFLAWAAESGAQSDPTALLVAFAAASVPRGIACVALDGFGPRRIFAVTGPNPGDVTEAENTVPDLILRDLRLSRIATVRLGPDTVPVLTVTRAGEGLSVTLEAAPGQMDQPTALATLSNFAGRLEEPLRHLL